MPILMSDARLHPDADAAELVTAVLEGVYAAIRTHKVAYPEFQAAKSWLIEIGEGGEWPLLLDLLVEHVVEEVAAETQQGTKGSILGPYHLPDILARTLAATFRKTDPI